MTAILIPEPRLQSDVFFFSANSRAALIYFTHNVFGLFCGRWCLS